MNKPSFKIIIPTLNAKYFLHRMLNGINSQKTSIKNTDFFFIDSSSTDGTVDELNRNGYPHIKTIDRKTFNHGGTRQQAAKLNPEVDVLIYMTQDAYLAYPESIESILSFFKDPKVGAVCGRQLPHSDANPLAKHARLFNYPDKTIVKSKSDIPNLGIKVPFISNSFSAYRRSALMDVGGFPSNTILAEDMYVAAKMVLNGYKVVYSSEACCYHSHNYTPIEEFKRYFDIGVFHSRETWIRNNFGGAGGEGLRYVKSELKYVWPKPYWLIRSFITSAFKFAGYKLGQQENKLPLWLKKRLSMHYRFWDKPTE